MATASSGTPRFLSALKQTTQTLSTTRRPWTVFLDLTSLNLPPSIPDATTRVTQNLAHFRANYALILLLILLLSLIFHPLALIAYAATALAWFFLYFSRDEEQPLRLLGFQVPDVAVLVTLGAATILVVIWSGVWSNVAVAIAIGVVLVVLHAVLRSTDDLVADDVEAAPYANLLSDDDETNNNASPLTPL